MTDRFMIQQPEKWYKYPSDSSTSSPQHGTTAHAAPKLTWACAMSAPWIDRNHHHEARMSFVPFRAAQKISKRIVCLVSNAWTVRARNCGWRHVIAIEVFRIWKWERHDMVTTARVFECRNRKHRPWRSKFFDGDEGAKGTLLHREIEFAFRHHTQSVCVEEVEEGREGEVFIPLPTRLLMQLAKGPV